MTSIIACRDCPHGARITRATMMVGPLHQTACPSQTADRQTGGMRWRCYFGQAVHFSDHVIHAPNRSKMVKTIPFWYSRDRLGRHGLGIMGWKDKLNSVAAGNQYSK